MRCTPADGLPAHNAADSGDGLVRLGRYPRESEDYAPGALRVPAGTGLVAEQQMIWQSLLKGRLE